MSAETETDDVAREVVHPTTGQVLDLDDLETDHLAGELERVEDLLGELRAFRQELIDEGAARLDREGARKLLLGDIELETNPPTEDDYPVDATRAALRELIELKALEPGVAVKVITYPVVKAPSPRVDKREVNKLLKSSDPRVVAALEAVRNRRNTTRTLKVNRKKAKP